MAACATPGSGPADAASQADAGPDASDDALVDAAGADVAADADGLGDAAPDTTADGGLDVTGDAADATPDAAPDAAPDAGPETSPDTADGTDAGCGPGQFELPAGGCAEATCDAMSKALHDAIDALVAASNSCSADADCTVAPTGTACQGTCGQAIGAEQKDAFAAQLAGIDAKVCQATGYAGQCGYSTPKCVAPNPGCVAGKCVYSKPAGAGCEGPQPANTECVDKAWVCKAGYFKTFGATECLEATCANMSKAVGTAIADAVAKAKACTVDDECMVVSTSNQCFGTCGEAINGGMLNDVLLVVGWLDDHICKDPTLNYGPTCGFVTPGCVAPSPGCVDGQCVYGK